MGGSPPADLRAVEGVLDATRRIVVATGVVNVWNADVHEVARSTARLRERHGKRFVLGVGIGHPEATSRYRSPYAALSAYVDALLEDGLPPGDLVLAALGPRVLALAAARTAGAHPYFVPATHSRAAREILGDRPLLAPEHKVILDADPARARALARPVMSRYLALANYANNLRRLGWTDDDLADGGSDALVDAIVAHGSPSEVADRLRDHVRAGADHVAIQLLPSDSSPDEGEAVAALARVLQP